MIKAIKPTAMLGMLGGGQLGKFFVEAAHHLGYMAVSYTHLTLPTN